MEEYVGGWLALQQFFHFCSGGVCGFFEGDFQNGSRKTFHAGEVFQNEQTTFAFEINPEFRENFQ